MPTNGESDPNNPMGPGKVALIDEGLADTRARCSFRKSLVSQANVGGWARPQPHYLDHNCQGTSEMDI